MSASTIRPFAGAVEMPDFLAVRLRWLVRVRFLAMGGLLMGACVGAMGGFPGLAWPVWAGAAVLGVGVNLLLAGRLKDTKPGPATSRGIVGQVAFDYTLLTVVLWAAGQPPAPLFGFYVFHIVLLGTFVGRSAALAGAAAAGACALGLVAVRFVPALRIGAWSPASVALGTTVDVFAYVVLLGGVAYAVSTAVHELRERERALGLARAQVELDYQLLTNTLNELEAGLEVIDGEGRILWRNRLAARLTSESTSKDQRWSCAGHGRACAADGGCPVDQAQRDGIGGRCRFAAALDGDERVFEMLSFPLSAATPETGRVMNLYVDRTQATLAERSLVQAERLVSLGRVAQGVAHELNTPLATLQTLAADLRTALSALSRSAPPTAGAPELSGPEGRTGALAPGEASAPPPALVSDLVESAEAIHAETRRLGRITQALLVGADLVRGPARRPATIGALLERARAAVVAGAHPGPAPVLVRGELEGRSFTGDPEALVQVFVNLLQNALDAVRDRRPTPTIDVVVLPLQAGGLDVRVEDAGPGIDPRVARRLFEPFATTKPPGEGTGLGLYASKKLVESFGGRLRLEPRSPEPGTRAVVSLPDAVLAPVASHAPLPHREPS